MTNVFTLMPEDDPLPKKVKVVVKAKKATLKQRIKARWQRTWIYKQYTKGCDICRRSWTFKVLKSPYAPIILTFFGLFLAAACLVLFAKAETWWLREKVVSAQTIGIHTAKAAPPTFEDKIREAFGVHADTFLKIAHAESGQNAGVKGYNCFYFNAKGERYSASCKTEDRAKAWSVDCGALQVNVYGKVCPVELFDLDKNLEAAKGKFARQGFGAWSVCNQKKVICK